MERFDLFLQWSELILFGRESSLIPSNFVIFLHYLHTVLLDFSIHVIVFFLEHQIFLLIFLSQPLEIFNFNFQLFIFFVRLIKQLSFRDDLLDNAEFILFNHFLAHYLFLTSIIEALHIWDISLAIHLASRCDDWRSLFFLWGRSQWAFLAILMEIGCAGVFLHLGKSIRSFRTFLKAIRRVVIFNTLFFQIWAHVFGWGVKVLSEILRFCRLCFRDAIIDVL